MVMMTGRLLTFFFSLQKMGVVMRAAVKSQINLVMRQTDSVRQLQGVRDIIYPIMWLHDGLETMEDEDTIFLLQTAVETPERARSAMYPTLLVLGLLLLLPALGVAIKKHLHHLDGEEENTELEKVAGRPRGVGNSGFSYEQSGAVYN